MQIQVNLLPGAKKGTTKRAASGASVGAAFTDLAAKVRDPWLVGAAGAVVVSVATVGLLFTAQQATASELATRNDRAVRDSTRYATVLEARRELAAERDSVHRQVQIIRTIDENRYVWAHLLDEISEALPLYTWLTTVEQTSKPPVPPGVDTTPANARRGAAKAAAKPAGKNAKPEAEAKPDTIVVHTPVTFRLVGQTVDMQALTLFMKELESSAFIQQVTLVRSEIVVAEGKDVTEFELAAQYEVPDRDAIRTESLVVPVR